ncbi:hypothetical protein IFM89_011078 [Coptis chinensis]|uniref:RRM domain-containing protein n=1 Tax=Coptis chinensis TaxID=261450 RepID=A0A835IPC3_9MAGN|nr:hypothetical protein IFM89_011078 [Coptis chinensis]
MSDYGNNNDAFMRNSNAAVQARVKAQSRANVQQLKLIGQSHPTGLTSSLLKLFEPRAPLEYKAPPEKKKCPPYSGMAQYVSNFAEPGTAEYDPPAKKAETATQRRARVHQLRLESGAKKAAEELEKYDPSNDPNISGDPYKTLFVARLSYETTESKIKREFEQYGPIKKVGTLGQAKRRSGYCLLTCSVRMVTDKSTNKPRGYAFIEYAHTRDMKSAYKQGDGRKLNDRRVLVDVERGRTVPNWRPRRLGGGLGSTRIGGDEVNMKYSGREPQQLTSGGPSHSEEPRSREERHVDRDRRGERDREHDNMELDHGHGYDLPEPEHDLYEPRGEGQYSHLEPQTDHERYDHDSERKYDRYDEEDEEYRYDRDISEPREREKIRDQGWDYRHSERSVSREIEH